MIKLGYKLMSEEHGPNDLVRNARRAEEAGFEFAAISDHFSPWIEEQGHASFAWSVLGALAQATQRMGLMTAVTCPIMRYHPAIIAQAAATIGLLSGDRFTLGLGAGERLNEHVIGEGWPGLGERHDRLSEAIDVIQGLLTGQLTNYRGSYFRLDHARLFDRPDRKPAIVLAAGGPEAARLAARKGDGLIATEPRVPISSRRTAPPVAPGRAMPRWRCAVPSERRMHGKRRIIIFAGRSPGGR
jgi:G6PDH family F420-dependent oxidoreductase